MLFPRKGGAERHTSYAFLSYFIFLFLNIYNWLVDLVINFIFIFCVKVSPFSGFVTAVLA